MTYTELYLSTNFAEKTTKTERNMTPLERLRQQYINNKKCFSLPLISDQMFKIRDYYNAMRLFCIDCELIPFNDIEVMEYEVNEELKQK